jgi:uncharacterized protein (TIGR04255 family)
MAPLPNFDSPPVVETVLGVQFAPLKNFSVAHAGIFWKERLSESWTKFNDEHPILDQFEKFEDGGTWRPLGIQLGPADKTFRVQIIERDDERMIQLQNSRFVYNWRKRTGEYPSYEKLKPEFQERFGEFRQFVSQTDLGPLDLNQWEVTYVNHIPKQGLWSTISDWPEVFPGILGRASKFGASLDSFSTQWRAVLGESKGRLYATVRHIRVDGTDGEEMIDLTFVARGPVDPSVEEDLERGFELGHSVIVKTLAELTSEKAHKFWRRTA